MTITRKNRFEVWPEGASAYTTQHNDRVEAIEAAQGLGAGTHSIRVAEPYMEVVNPAAGFVRVGDQIKVSAISVMVNGVERDVLIPADAGDLVSVTVSGVLLGEITA